MQRSRVARTAKHHQDDSVLPAQEPRVVLVTDGTFDGLLTALFEVYASKTVPDAVEPRGNEQMGLFDRRISILTDRVKSDRVWQGLEDHLGSKRRREIFDAYLSGMPGVETAIYRLVRDTIPRRGRRNTDAHLTSHIKIKKLSQKVRREAHRMKGFIRFQQIGDDLYLALVAPQYDILPLIRHHFEARFADQSWIIYDTQRNYGLYYDKQHTRELRLDSVPLNAFGDDDIANERLWQALWRQYYAAANISQRNNPRLHLRQLPRRYWRYLPQKQT